jgi:hypothetical protein
MKSALAPKPKPVLAVEPVLRKHWLNPLRLLRAVDRYKKYRAAEKVTHKSLSTAERDVIRAKLRDFMTAPHC